MMPKNSKLEIHPIYFRDELFFEIAVTDDEDNMCSIQVTVEEADDLISSLAEHIKELPRRRDE